MSSSLKWFLVFLALLEFNHETTLVGCKYSPNPNHYDMYVGSKLPENSPPIKANCVDQSTAKAAFDRTFTPGTGYHWDFYMVPSITLIRCNFRWGSTSKSFKAFDSSDLGSYCQSNKEVYWWARPDGLYFSCDAFGNGTKRYDWDQSSANHFVSAGV